MWRARLALGLAFRPYLGEQPQHGCVGIFGELGNALHQEQAARVGMPDRHGNGKTGGDVALSGSLFICVCVCVCVCTYNAVSLDAWREAF